MWRYTENLIIACSVALGGAALFFAAYFLYRFYINQRLKGKYLKISLPRISSVLLACILLVAGTLAGYFISVAETVNKHRLYARIGFLRADNAQYVPDIFKLPKSVPAGANPDESLGADYKNFKTMTTDVTLGNYGELVNMLGTIDSHYNEEFTVLKLKEEIKEVFQNVNVFNKWVKLKSGALSGIGEYFLSYDEKTHHMTVLRKRSFTPYVWDNDKQKSIQTTHDVLYKMDFAYGENGIETFECEIFSLLYAFGKSYVRQYQYIKNVKDTSFTKYIISPLAVIGEISDNPLYEVDSDNPYGSECRFVQLDYSGDTMEMLFVNQAFASAYNGMPDITSVNLYKSSPAELTLYNTAFSSDLSKYYGGSLLDKTFYNGLLGQNDLMKMYSEQGIHRTALPGNPYNYTENPKELYGSEITGQQREILYKDETGVMIFNNFSGYTLIGEESKLAGSFNYLTGSLASLAKNTGLQSPAQITAPAAGIKTADSAFENRLQERLGEIAENAVKNSYLSKNYKNTLKKAGKYILI